MKYRRKIFIFFIIFVLKSQLIESDGVEDFTYSCGVHTPKKGIYLIDIIYILLFHNKTIFIDKVLRI